MFCDISTSQQMAIQHEIFFQHKTKATVTLAHCPADTIIAEMFSVCTHFMCPYNIWMTECDELNIKLEILNVKPTFFIYVFL